MAGEKEKPFRIVGEVTIWEGHEPDKVKAMKEGIRKRNEQGINALNDEPDRYPEG